jgi:MoaA/NifB/PqqE/SkfB family radical SAM enzyme
VHGRLDIHLLSNGMLLTPERVERLIAHGVTSLAVSLDGASVHSNDKLRLGGSFHTVVKNLEAALTLRARTNADLRIGISTVVSKSSVRELDALALLCAQLGVDWLKLEEMYGATCVAVEELVPAGDAQLVEGVAKLEAHLQEHGVVFVNHLESKRACACAAGPSDLAFRSADDFANRAHFRPCRMLWEQAAVDPDGTLRPVDYSHGALGSLLDSSFIELWNGDAMRAARAAQVRHLSASAREQCARS